LWSYAFWPIKRFRYSYERSGRAFEALGVSKRSVPFHLQADLKHLCISSSLATKRLDTKNGGQWYLQGRQYWTDETDDEDAAFLRKAISTLHQAGRAVAGIKGAK